MLIQTFGENLKFSLLLVFELHQKTKSILSNTLL